MAGGGVHGAGQLSPWLSAHPNPERRIPNLPIFHDILKKYGLR